MEKRNKLWRKRHQWRLFKERLVRQAAWQTPIWDETGNLIPNPHWFEYVNQPWCLPYKTIGRPCSCWICKKARYNRRDYKKATQRIIREELE